VRFRNTWILLAVVVAFLAYFFFIEQPRHRQKLESEELSDQLTTLRAEDIHHITIERPGETLQFMRQEDSWRMTSPVADAVDEASINTLLLTAVNARVESKFAVEEKELSDFGLGEPPDVKLTLETQDRDTTLVITTGSHNITKSHCYARKDTFSEVLLLPAGLRRYALREVAEFRNKKVIEFMVDRVRELEITSAEQMLSWEKDAENRWVSFMRSDTIKGDKRDINGILSGIRALRVKEFVSDDPSDFEKYFSDEKKSISLWIGSDRSKKTILFGKKKEDGCYIKRESEDRTVLIDSTILDVFEKTYRDLRDRRLLHFQRIDIARIQLETRDTLATIIKTGGEWAFENPVLGSIEQYKVSNILHKMENLKYDYVIEEHLRDTSAYGFSQPSFRLTVYGTDESIIDELICGSYIENGQFKYATSRITGVLAKVRQNALEDLERAFHDIRKQ
jgi:hypothetical protein